MNREYDLIKNQYDVITQLPYQVFHQDYLSPLIGPQNFESLFYCTQILFLVSDLINGIFKIVFVKSF